MCYELNTMRSCKKWPSPYGRLLYVSLMRLLNFHWGRFARMTFGLRCLMKSVVCVLDELEIDMFGKFLEIQYGV